MGKAGGGGGGSNHHHQQQMQQQMMMMGQMAGKGGGKGDKKMVLRPMRAGVGVGGSKPGEWQCPNDECRNHRNNVFAKHTTCPSCGAPNPGCGGGDMMMRNGRERSPRR